MTTAKDEVRRLLDTLPDDATYEDIQYHIYVLEKVAEGVAAADAGDLLSHEEVVRRLSKWVK